MLVTFELFIMHVFNHVLFFSCRIVQSPYGLRCCAEAIEGSGT